MISYQKLFIYLLVPFVFIFALLVDAITNQKGVFSSSAKDGITFTCSQDNYNGKMVPATILNKPKSQTQTTIILWKPDNYYFGKKWTPEERCKEVATRFQRIHDRDGLKYVFATVDSWVADRDVPIICGVKQENTPCKQDDLLFTLETKDDPNVVLKSLMDRRNFPSTSPELVRGKQPETFAEGKRVYYDISEIFIDEEPEEPAF